MLTHWNVCQNAGPMTNFVVFLVHCVKESSIYVTHGIICIDNKPTGESSSSDSVDSPGDSKETAAAAAYRERGARKETQQVNLPLLEFIHLKAETTDTQQVSGKEFNQRVSVITFQGFRGGLCGHPSG